MPLPLQTGEGSFHPYLKYNAKAGRFYAKGAQPASGKAADVEVEKPRLVFDFDNIKTGWIVYSEGVGPEKVFDASFEDLAPKPNSQKAWKRGFEVMVVGPDNVNGIGRLGLREMTSTAGAMIHCIQLMYDAWEAGRIANPGKVPFYQCDGVKPISGAHGTNYEPIFTLKAWIDRAKVPELQTVPQRSSAAPPPVAMPQARQPAPPVQSADPFGAGPLDGKGDAYEPPAVGETIPW